MCAMGSAMQPSVSQIIRHKDEWKEDEKRETERDASHFSFLLTLSASLSGKVQTTLESAHQQPCRPIRRGPRDPVIGCWPVSRL